MREFGKWRYVFGSKGLGHKLYFYVAGVSPDHKLRYLYLKKLYSLIKNKQQIHKILDAGCGSGDYSFYFSQKYPSAKVVGIDFDKDRVLSNNDIIHKVGARNIRFDCCSIEKITEKNEYDFICCIDVLEHVENQDEAISRLFDALKEKGSLYVHIPLKKAKRPIFDRHLSEFHKWADEEHIAEEDTRESFLEKMRRAGFLVNSERYTFNHCFGELAVSLTMMFFKPTAINNLIRAALFPIMTILIYADIFFGRKRGNALALLASKP